MGGGVALALTVLGIGNAIDRHAETDRTFLLPFAAGANHRSGLADAALARGDLALATGQARATLERQPLDERAIRVLGSAAMLRGDAAFGDRMMRLAGGLGWRDPVTQVFWGRAALAGGATRIAAERLDAVLRSRRPAEAISREALSLMHALEASAAGRQAIVDRLRQRPAWSDAYLADVGGLDAAGMGRRLALIALAGRSGVPLPADTLIRLQWSLVDNGAFTAARRLWRATNPKDGDAPIGNGGFDHFDPFDLVSPFDWTVIASSDMEARLEPASRGEALRVEVLAPLMTPVMRQVVTLPTGTWWLEGSVAGARTAMPIAVGMRCLTANGSATATALPAPPSRFRISIRIDDRRCAAQLLELDVAGAEAGADGTVSLLLDDIVVHAPGLSAPL